MKLRPALFLAAAFIVTTGMLSCTRDYTCQCEISYTGQPGLPDTTMNEYSIKDTRKNAEKICTQNSYENEKGGIKTVEKCQLY